MSPGRLPNFLHLGPGKAGSTWLFEVLSQHDDVYLSAAKDLYYFSRCYDRGDDWYRSQFSDAAPGQTVVGEISPDYLSNPEAPSRILATLGPDVSLMVTLRDPVGRAFSSHLYLAKHGLAGATFRETLETVPAVLDEARYATMLGRYIATFGRDRLHVALFDDLQADPQSFLDEATRWLGIARLELTAELYDPVLPAATARWLPAAALSRHVADVVRRCNGARVVGRVKSAPIVQRLLYRPLGEDRPTPSEADVQYVRESLNDEVEAAEAELGLPLRQRWGWTIAGPTQSSNDKSRYRAARPNDGAFSGIT